MGRSTVQIHISGPVPQGLTLFETMRVEGDGRIVLWPLHLARLQRGCAAVGFPYDLARIEAAISMLPHGAVLRARLSVDSAGQVALTHAPLPENPPFWRVVVSDQRLQSDDPWLMIKSSVREIYDAARASLSNGVDEALLLNQRGEVCEGSITNLFLKRDGILMTPHLRCGLLPGVLRANLLAKGQAVEAVMMPDDLADGDLFFGNALRGLIPARLV
jgi:4-amino-4-deoxychorismate lyase